MKVLVTPTSFFKQQNIEAVKRLEAFADVIVKNPYSRPLEPDEIIPLLDGVDGYIAGLDYISSKVLSEAPPSLKVISRYGAGYDRVDIQKARERKISVTNTPGTNSRAVCELAFGLMLSLSRSIVDLDRAVKNGEWPRCEGSELYGKKLGIVGFGAIGRELAQRAIAFGMEVYAYDPCFNKEFADKYGVIQCGLDELCSACRYISLHLPLNEQTRHIVDETRFSKMKDNTILINTARGGLIDEHAAVKALDSGKLAGLALDVYEIEPVTDNPLFGKRNVIMTPHTGAHTQEAIEAMGIMAVDNLITELNGKVSQYRIK